MWDSDAAQRGPRWHGGGNGETVARGCNEGCGGGLPGPWYPESPVVREEEWGIREALVRMWLLKGVQGPGGGQVTPLRALQHSWSIK